MTWALIPAKGVARAKSRLSATLTSGERGRLALNMLETVLRAVTSCPTIAGVTVVSDCQQVFDLARRFGADLEPDPAPSAPTRVFQGEPTPRWRAAHPPPNVADATGLGAVVDHGLTRIAARGGEQALVVMGDLPFVTREDVSATLDRLATHDVVLAPDRWNAGTNALGLRLAGRPPTCFGHADSLRRHEAVFARAGRTIARVARPGLAFDVDTPEDLATWGVPQPAARLGERP